MTKAQRAAAILTDLWIEGAYASYRNGAWGFRHEDTTYEWSKMIREALTDVEGSIRGGLKLMEAQGLVAEQGHGKKYFVRLTAHEMRRDRRGAALRKGRRAQQCAAIEALEAVGIIAERDGWNFIKILTSDVSTILTAMKGEK